MCWFFYLSVAGVCPILNCLQCQLSASASTLQILLLGDAGIPSFLFKNPIHDFVPTYPFDYLIVANRDYSIIISSIYDEMVVNLGHQYSAMLQEFPAIYLLNEYNSYLPWPRDPFASCGSTVGRPCNSESISEQTNLIEKFRI